MSIRERIQQDILQTTKARNHARLEALRMAKAAILLKEKEKARDTVLSDEEATAVLRGEVRKRRQSLETYAQLGKQDVVTALDAEIAVFEEYLPRQLSPEAMEDRVKSFLAAHPELTHVGKATGALKKELGDAADGKLLSELCTKYLEEHKGS